MRYPQRRARDREPELGHQGPTFWTLIPRSYRKKGKVLAFSGIKETKASERSFEDLEGRSFPFSSKCFSSS